jgi:thioredoxin reductase (NADPH)
MVTTDVENYPGFPDGIMGPELMDQFRKQAERFGARLMTTDVTEVDFSHHPFVVRAGADEHRTNTVIVATGATAKWLDVPGEQRLTGRGVSACATCDGFFFRDKELVVVGGGDSAMEEATFLTKFASRVTIVHRRDEFRASKIMLDRAQHNEKITFTLDSVVDDILDPAKGEVVAAKLRNVKSNEITQRDVSAVFVAIGHIPNTAPFKGQLDMDADGYLKTEQGTRTKVPGVYACGDVQDRVFRQAITASGSGCMAAIEAERFLEHGDK